jgi:hypothetical protein
MMTPGQIWVTRRLSDIIDFVEEAAGDISIDDYPNFETWMVDVFDSALNRLGDEGYTDENEFLDKYASIISALEDIFKEQLQDFYKSEESELIGESFDRVLDLYQKVNKGEELRPSEQSMMRAFKKFVDKGGNAEDFEYSDDEDYDVDEREGEKFTYDVMDMPMTYTFSEEYQDGDEINYFGEIIFEDDEFLGIISTDKRGFLTGYDFYSVLDEDVRLQDKLQDMQIEDEVMNFFAEEVIPILRR